MAAVNGGVPGEGASDREDPLGLAMQLMAQALAQMQAAVHQQEDRRRQTLTQDERMQEAMAQVGLNKVAIRALTDRVRRLEERVGAVEVRGGVVPEQQPLELLERRVGSLETSIQRALESAFPRVEALVAQLEKSSSTASPVFFSSSAAAPNSTSTPGSSLLHASSATAQNFTSTPEPRPILHASTSADADIFVTRNVSKYFIRHMMKCVTEDRVPDVRRLLHTGVDVNCRDASGWTPLMIAAKFVYIHLLVLLLRGGADIRLSSNDGVTALHCSTITNNSRTGHCVRMLVREGADVRSRDEHGNTPLHEAVRRDNKPAVRALLDSGASPTAVNNKGEMPLDLAQNRSMQTFFYIRARTPNAQPQVQIRVLQPTNSTCAKTYKVVTPRTSSVRDIKELCSFNRIHLEFSS